MNLIEMKNIYKSYKDLTIFEDLNLIIETGKIYGIVGPNGSGKSVLFKLICGFIRPNHGEVLIRGEYLHKDITFPKDFGIIIDRPGYLGNKTGFENLKSLARIQNKINDEQIIKTMDLVGLQSTSEQKVQKYSLGMKQKLALAQAFMENQETLILDEPFNALDFESVKKLHSLLLNYKKEGKTIIMTSHNQEDIDLLCDEVYRIDKFKLESL